MTDVFATRDALDVKAVGDLVMNPFVAFYDDGRKNKWRAEVIFSGSHDGIRISKFVSTREKAFECLTEILENPPALDTLKPISALRQAVAKLSALPKGDSRHAEFKDILSATASRAQP